MGRNARGVRGMALEPGQRVIAMLVAEQDDETRALFRTLYLGHSRGELSMRYPLHANVGHLFTEGVVGTTTADTARFSRRKATTLHFDEPFLVNLQTDVFGLYCETAVNTAGAVPATITLYGAGFLNAVGQVTATDGMADIATAWARFSARFDRARSGVMNGIADLRDRR